MNEGEHQYVDKPRVMLYDIETSYLITKTWNIWQTDVIGAGKGVIEDFQILCFAYKWLDDPQTYVVAQDDFPDYVPGVNNDYNVVEYLWNLFNISDIIIGHNSDSFDNKKSQARMIHHGFPPTSPYQQIDTKKIAKRHFAFTSNKLDDIASHFGIEGKFDAGGINTWDKCIEGNPEAWRQMKEYNIQDVIVTEQIYLHMRSWMNNHPNMANLEGRPEICPKCGSDEGMLAQGWRITKTGRYRRWQCKNCGSYVSSRTQEKGLERPEYV